VRESTRAPVAPRVLISEEHRRFNYGMVPSKGVKKGSKKVRGKKKKSLGVSACGGGMETLGGGLEKRKRSAPPWEGKRRKPLGKEEAC